MGFIQFMLENPFPSILLTLYFIFNFCQRILFLVVVQMVVRLGSVFPHRKLLLDVLRRLLPTYSTRFRIPSI